MAHPSDAVSTEARPNSTPLELVLARRRLELQRLCLHWTRGRRCDAEDLLGDAVLHAIEARSDRLTGIEDAMAWLTTIVRNLGRDRLRARAHTSASEDLEADDERLGVSSLGQEEAVAAKHELTEVASTLASLTRTQRQALVGRMLGDEYDEIAQNLGVSESHARKLVQLARDRIRGVREA